eukprot:jgi/Mesvir1/20950/Mv08021-RA.1
MPRRRQYFRWLLFAGVTYLVIVSVTVLRRRSVPSIPEEEGDVEDEGRKASSASCGSPLYGKALNTPQAIQRTNLYATMANSFLSDGAQALSGGSTSQGLKTSDLFLVQGGRIMPILKRLEHPVRAMVLPVQSASVSQQISHATQQALSRNFGQDDVWFQDPSMYHLSVWHASHHMETIPATSAEVRQEFQAIQSVASSSCPLIVAVDRVVATTTGVLILCWQLLDGTEPMGLRHKLKQALPNCPKHQIVKDWAILHTTIARIVQTPKSVKSDPDPLRQGVRMQRLLLEATDELNRQLCALEVKGEGGGGGKAGSS